jgi:hypothetical protein
MKTEKRDVLDVSPDRTNSMADTLTNVGKERGEKDIDIVARGLAEYRIVGGEEKIVLTELDEHDDPKRFSLLHKWFIIIIVSTAALCTACTSSIVRAFLDCQFSLLISSILGMHYRRHLLNRVKRQLSVSRRKLLSSGSRSM